VSGVIGGLFATSTTLRSMSADPPKDPNDDTKVRGKGSGMGSVYGPCPKCGGSGWTGDPDEEDEAIASGDVDEL
jgi:hypothetical protein